MKFTKNISGYLQPFDRKAVEALSSIQVGQVVEVKLTAKKRKPQRSQRQNAYYWGVVIPYFVNGSKHRDPLPISSVKLLSEEGLRVFHEGIKRFEHPHQYPVGIEKNLYQLREELIIKLRGIA